MSEVNLEVNPHGKSYEKIVLPITINLILPEDASLNKSIYEMKDVTNLVFSHKRGGKFRLLRYVNKHAI